MGSIHEERVPTAASAAEKFCNVRMEKRLVESVNMETIPRTLQKNVMAEARLQEVPEWMGGEGVKKKKKDCNFSFRKLAGQRKERGVMRRGFSIHQRF